MTEDQKFLLAYYKSEYPDIDPASFSSFDEETEITFYKALHLLKEIEEKINDPGENCDSEIGACFKCGSKKRM